ncbi:hypothetical protein OSB04_026185 [Centaurea solstitialis]|uniref:IPO4/5-like TPR repeats domain-containing protein n=1 Tax=Centaurea solstitialis TaxID=347529 RepID=A0AA38SCN3_9ASTR|nr:hypothetical protein OSB04_026185 [Centaurea solstitialis]
MAASSSLDLIEGGKTIFDQIKKQIVWQWIMRFSKHNWLRYSDLAPLETLISHLVSQFVRAKIASTGYFSPHEGARDTSATLLRTHGLLIWDMLSLAVESSLKGILIECAKQEEAKPVMKLLCITISKLASMILPLNGWPELLRFAFDYSKSDSPNLEESSTSRSLDVKLVASSVVASFIQVFSHSGGDLMLFRDVLRAMMMTLKEALNSQQEAATKELLKLLIELVEVVPGFFRRELDEVLEHMMQIAITVTLEEGTRHLAIGFLITLVEVREREPMMRKLIDDLVRFPRRLFVILLKMLRDIEDEPAWYTTDNEDEDAGGSSNYSAAKDYLGSFAIAADALDVTVVAFEQLCAYLDSPEWQEPHAAALIALACIIEGCAEKMIQSIETVMQMAHATLASEMFRDHCTPVPDHP